MTKKGFIALAVVFAVAFILLGLTKCGYDKIEEMRGTEEVVPG